MASEALKKKGRGGGGGGGWCQDIVVFFSNMAYLEGSNENILLYKNRQLLFRFMLGVALYNYTLLVLHYIPMTHVRHSVWQDNLQAEDSFQGPFQKT